MIEVQYKERKIEKRNMWTDSNLEAKNDREINMRINREKVGGKVGEMRKSGSCT